MEAQLETAETPIAKVGMGRTERGTAQRARAEQSQEKKSMSSYFDVVVQNGGATFGGRHERRKGERD